MLRKETNLKFWAQEKSLSVLLIILSIHIFIIIPYGQKTFFQSSLFLFFYLVLISAGIIYMFNSMTVQNITLCNTCIPCVYGLRDFPGQPANGYYL